MRRQTFNVPITKKPGGLGWAFEFDRLSYSHSLVEQVALITLLRKPLLEKLLDLSEGV